MDYHQHTVPAGPPLVAVPAPSHPLTHHQLHQLQTLVQAEDSTSSRWSQYHQLLRHHHMQHINGRKTRVLGVCFYLVCDSLGLVWGIILGVTL